jgi:hypothetical protein
MSDELPYAVQRDSGQPSGLSNFDRTIGLLHGLNDVTQTKPSTIQVVPAFGIGTQLFIVQTFRQREMGDTIFLQCVSEGQTIRMVVPPQVSDAIARQRDQITGRVRSKAAKATAQARKDAGLKPGFMKGKARK